MKKSLLLSLALLYGAISHAQTVAIKKIELAGEKIIVHYDLEDSNPGNEYKLDLFSSKDNFAAPLAKVSGDIGSEIKPGYDRKVEWNITQEIGTYKGRIALELKGKVYLPFVKIQSFDVTKAYKRGKSYNLQWKAGNTNPIHIELYKGGQRIAGEMNQPNNGAHTFFIPAKASKGSDYRLKITDAKQSEEVIYTKMFKVKPKIPFLFKVLPVAGVLGGFVFVAGQSDGEGPQPKGNEIPDPDFPRN